VPSFAESGAELQLDVFVVGSQDGQRLIEVVVTLANRSPVRRPYRDFRVIVRYLLPTDPIRDGDDAVQHQLEFPHSIDSRIPAGGERTFANAESIDPGVTSRHSYITFVPADATFLLVQCGVEFPSASQGKAAKRSIQRLVRIGP
jgi:hypothetical protein